MHQVCLYNFKDRTECFDDYYFPYRKRDNCKLEHHVSNWMMNQFVYMHIECLLKEKLNEEPSKQ
jgi:hypothetical protein